MTPSLINFLQSIFFGALLVIVPIIVALIIVSRLDPITRVQN
jgi:hypothetical protein|uniref:Photosystem II reaction center protein X n=1 Tax=Poterioochromonas malhamensis TaxID=88167 RepID=A0A7T6Y7I3_9STRA|nr:X 4.1 kDa protein of photosystem II [Poterioochromonas malhamensis]QQK55013.1 X 4.1 kDa protein of photosystem II [Poterioochromonas malhamensis]